MKDIIGWLMQRTKSRLKKIAQVLGRNIELKVVIDWVMSIFLAWVVIGLINWDFLPWRWSDGWQAAWLITSLQMCFFVRLKSVIHGEP